jgi:hypothetical protein
LRNVFSFSARTAERVSANPVQEGVGSQGNFSEWQIDTVRASKLNQSLFSNNTTDP